MVNLFRQRNFKNTTLVITQIVSLAVAFTFQTNAYATVTSHSALKHNIREIVTYDSEGIEKLVSQAINSNEPDDDVFYSQAAEVLEGTILVHPRFSEREAGLSRLRSKMEQEEFFEVMRRAGKDLLAILDDSQASASDQASALIALTNWVTEARHLPPEELESSIKAVASANIEISDEARDFGREPLEHLISPSEEAKLALAK